MSIHMLHKQAILITSKGDIVKLKPGSTFRAPITNLDIYGTSTTVRLDWPLTLYMYNTKHVQY